MGCDGDVGFLFRQDSIRQHLVLTIDRFGGILGCHQFEVFLWELKTDLEQVVFKKHRICLGIWFYLHVDRQFTIGSGQLLRLDLFAIERIFDLDQPGQLFIRRIPLIVEHPGLSPHGNFIACCFHRFKISQIDDLLIVSVIPHHTVCA